MTNLYATPTLSWIDIIIDIPDNEDLQIGKWYKLTISACDQRALPYFNSWPPHMSQKIMREIRVRLYYDQTCEIQQNFFEFSRDTLEFSTQIRFTKATDKKIFEASVWLIPEEEIMEIATFAI